MLLETIITIGLLGFGVNQERESRDVYKVDISRSIQTTDGSGVITYGQPATVMPWGVPSYSSLDIITEAFGEIGLNHVEGDHLIGVAKNILATLYPGSVQIIPVVARDPEEGVSFLTLRFHVNADFEETLKLDSALTRELVSKVQNIPEKLSFAVYEMETASS